MPVMLHTHSWYSLLEGASSLETLLDRAAACGYTSLALTDSNNLYGAVKFTQLAQRHGVRPLLGACLRGTKPAGASSSLRGSTHCLALIAEPVGYRNLCRIISGLYLAPDAGDLRSALRRGRRPTPNAAPGRGLVALLQEHAEGLHLLVDDLALAAQLREAYGRRLWWEVIRPRPGQSPQQEQQRLAAARRLGLRPVASTAVHLATPAEYPVFRLATVIRQGGLLDQLPARLAITPAHHLLGPQEFCERFRDLPDAVRNTDWLARQLRSDVLPHETVLPPARLPRRWDETEYLRRLCERGLTRRGLNKDAAAAERLREELAVINAMGLEAYFLVVRDIARHARHQGYTMALRGSAGNSLVCYLLEITDVNPLRFNLPPERFLHPGRPDLPDIDLDFDWKVRDRVIAHVFERYGQEHTAMISAHLFLQPRSAFRETAKAHGLSNEQISRLLESVGDWNPEASAPALPPQFPLEPPRWARIVQDARRLLGRPHHLSVHPGGIVITPRPIADYVPLQRAPKGVVITQFEKDAIEHSGLVKIDLLGNRALATVDEARAGVRSQRSEVRGQRSEVPCSARVESPRTAVRGLLTSAHASPSTLPPPPFFLHPPRSALHSSPDALHDDPATLDLIRRGDTLGVNQLESPAMRHLLMQLQPRGVEDVILALALVRPGAASGGVKEHYLLRRHGREPYALHPRLEPVLRDTAGFMIFEDDAARVVGALSGWSAPQAQQFYKRVVKHEGEAELHALAEEFFLACAAQRVPRDVAALQFVQLTKFQHYAFCKSHAVSYGLIAWQACCLKAHHPLAFWTAALNNNQGMYPRRVYVEALKRGGIRLLLPCVNRSRGPFSVERGEERVERGARSAETVEYGEGNAERKRGVEKDFPPSTFHAPRSTLYSPRSALHSPRCIRVGLEAIAMLPEELRQRLLEERARHGPYRDVRDLLRRAGPGPEALAALIRCGALDFTGRPRPALFLDAELAGFRPEPQPRGEQLPDLFAAEPGLAPSSWAPPDYAALRRWRDEWDLLGFLVGPPLMTLFRGRLPAGLVPSRDLAAHRGRSVRVAGVVATYRNATTQDGRDMQFVTLEDEGGLIEVTLFPGTCPLVTHFQLGPYIATGTVEEDLGVVTVNATRVELA